MHTKLIALLLASSAMAAHAAEYQLMPDEHPDEIVIDVASLDAAPAWAAKAPAADTGGSAEVRPLAPVPGMAR